VGHNGKVRQADINVHDVLPVTTPLDKQMMPPADRIYDPGQGAKKDLTDTGDDFLAIGPALQIMQLNVEGLSAAKREVISSIAERQKIRLADNIWLLAHDNNNNSRLGS